MIRKFKASLLLVLAIFSFNVPVFAQTETETTSGTDESVQTTNVTEDRSAGREARIKSYKEKAATKLADAQAKRLASRCKSAQGKITSLRARMKVANANRKKVYQEVGVKLDNLLEKLKAANLDTTKLETARTDIETELTTLTESLDSYETVLADLEEMDCAADPDVFQAALASARELQTELRTQAQEFRRFATSELREIIQEIRKQLETKQTTEEQQDDTTTEGEE